MNTTNLARGRTRSRGHCFKAAQSWMTGLFFGILRPVRFPDQMVLSGPSVGIIAGRIVANAPAVCVMLDMHIVVFRTDAKTHGNQSPRRLSQVTTGGRSIRESFPISARQLGLQVLIYCSSFRSARSRAL